MTAAEPANAMNTVSRPAVAGRLLASLPGIYQQADAGTDGELQTLLAAFEHVLLGVPGAPDAEGFEQSISAIPNLLAEQRSAGGFEAGLRDAFVPWLASSWVGFTPFAHFDASRLRRIVAGIVPLYARRGTAAYLEALLKLCFDEIERVQLREHLSGGLLVGKSRVGRSTVLGAARPFSFGVDVDLKAREQGWDAAALAAMRTSLLAVVDFAKPAHTVCELVLRGRQLDEEARPAVDDIGQSRDAGPRRKAN